MSPISNVPASQVARNSGDVLDVLDNLVEVARDEEEGFRQAAEKAVNRLLRNQMRQFCRERGEFVRELQGLERAYGRIEVDDSGSMGGAFRRVWVGMRTAVSRNDEKVLLEEAERGETSAHEAYQEALQHTGLPANVRNLLLSQSTEILKTRNFLREMKQSYSGT